MALTVTHADSVTVVPPDPNNPGKVQPSWWPKPHVVTGDLTPIVTLAEAQAALSAASIGSVWCLSDVGDGTYWRKSTGGILKPLNNHCVLADLAAPVTFSASTNAHIYGEFAVPAGLLQNGFHIQVDPVVSKSGTTSAITMNVALSATQGSIGTTIAQTATIAFMTAANRRAQAQYRFQRTAATGITNSVVNTNGYPATSGGAFGAVTVPSMAAATWLQVCMTADGAVDTVQLESCIVQIFGSPN